MKNISQVILLSTSCLIWYGADNVCASVNVYSGIPKSGTHTHDTHYLADDCPHLPSAQSGNRHRHPWAHSQSDARDLEEPGKNIDSLFNLDVRDKPEHDIRVASVCFITDTGACSGEKFGNGEEVSGGNGNPGGVPDYDTPAEQCQDAGYTQSPCPEGSVSVSCPADPSYHICKCSADYNQTCTAPNQGVGEACDGKYKECCNTCPGYDYSAIPAGYVSAGECDSCDGKKYQIKCDTSLYPLSAGSCGSLGGSGGSCTDDGGTYYEACKCPLNYEWSAAARKCICLADFKYTCAGTGYAGGSGESCDNKYRQCSCADGYYWDVAAGECLKSCANECALTSCASPYTCRYEDCSGKFCKTGCVSGYDWNEAAQTCTSQCAASYKYTCTASNQMKPSSESCDGKYTSCNCRVGYFWGYGKCCENSFKYECNGANERGYGAACALRFEICGCRGEYIWNQNDGKCQSIKTCTNNGKNCCIGQILNSDGTCSDNKISSKTPIGIVAYIGEDNKGQALALTEYGAASWGGYGVSFEFSQSTIEGEIDFDSCGNTQKIVAQGDSTAFPAAGTAVNYVPSNAPETKGKWCLPASGVGRMIVIYIDRINQGLSTAGGEVLSKTTDFDNQYWSSTPGGANYAIHWRYRSDLQNPDYFGSSDRRVSFRVRPVIEF